MTNKREKLSILFLVLGVVLYFGNNFYFGWNATAQSPVEGSFDFMVVVLLIASFICKPSNIENNYIKFINKDK